MIQLEAIRDRPDEHLVRGSMRHDVAPSDPEVAIVTLDAPARPDPAPVVSSNYFCEEPFLIAEPGWALVSDVPVNIRLGCESPTAATGWLLHFFLGSGPRNALPPNGERGTRGMLAPFPALPLAASRPSSRSSATMLDRPRRSEVARSCTAWPSSSGTLTLNLMPQHYHTCTVLANLLQSQP